MDNVFEITGTVYRIDETKEFGTNGFKKREVLIEYAKREYQGKEYSDIIKVIAEKNNADQFNLFNIGDNVKLGVTIKGRMWDSPDKGPVNFTEVKMVWVEKLNVINAPEPQVAQQNTAAAVDQAADNDLPF